MGEKRKKRSDGDASNKDEVRPHKKPNGGLGEATDAAISSVESALVDAPSVESDARKRWKDKKGKGKKRNGKSISDTHPKPRDKPAQPGPGAEQAEEQRATGPVDLQQDGVAATAPTSAGAGTSNDPVAISDDEGEQPVAQAPDHQLRGATVPSYTPATLENAVQHAKAGDFVIAKHDGDYHLAQVTRIRADDSAGILFINRDTLRPPVGVFHLSDLRKPYNLTTAHAGYSVNKLRSRGGGNMMPITRQNMILGKAIYGDGLYRPAYVQDIVIKNGTTRYKVVFKHDGHVELLVRSQLVPLYIGCALLMAADGKTEIWPTQGDNIHKQTQPSSASSKHTGSAARKVYLANFRRQSGFPSLPRTPLAVPGAIDLTGDLEGWRDIMSLPAVKNTMTKPIVNARQDMTASATLGLLCADSSNPAVVYSFSAHLKNEMAVSANKIDTIYYLQTSGSANYLAVTFKKSGPNGPPQPKVYVFERKPAVLTKVMCITSVMRSRLLTNRNTRTHSTKGTGRAYRKFLFGVPGFDTTGEYRVEGEVNGDVAGDENEEAEDGDDEFPWCPLCKANQLVEADEIADGYCHSDVCAYQCGVCGEHLRAFEEAMHNNAQLNAKAPRTYCSTHASYIGQDETADGGEGDDGGDEEHDGLDGHEAGLEGAAGEGGDSEHGEFEDDEFEGFD